MANNNKLDYLKKYQDSTTLKKKDNSKVVYRNQVLIEDNDNIDITMGRLVEQDDDVDFVPVFVETPESLRFSKEQKKQLLEALTKPKKQKSSSSSSESESESDSSRSRSRDKVKKEDDNDSDSDLSVERNVQQPQETIYRDPKTGQRITLEQKKQQDEDLRRKRLEEKGIKVISTKAVAANQERILSFSKGLVQQQQKEAKKKEQKDMLGKDEHRELELHQIRQSKFDDPMRQILQDDEHKQVFQTPNLRKIIKRCQFPTIPNRFSIEAGHRWDGVDRSNGYEKKYLSAVNQRRDQKLKTEMNDLRGL